MCIVDGALLIYIRLFCRGHFGVFDAPRVARGSNVLRVVPPADSNIIYITFVEVTLVCVGCAKSFSREPCAALGVPST